MSVVRKELLASGNEELVYYIIGIVSKTKEFKEFEKFWGTFKKDPSPDIMKSEGKKFAENPSLLYFLRCYSYLKSGNEKRVFAVLEDFVNDGRQDELMLLSIIMAMSRGLDCTGYFTFDDELLRLFCEAYNLYRQFDYRKAYEVITEMFCINRLYYLRELIYLLIAIELDMNTEVDLLLAELLKLNRNNEGLRLIQAYRACRNGDSARSMSLIHSVKEAKYDLLFKNLYLNNLLAMKQYDKAIDFLEHTGKTEEDTFLAGQLYHVIGALDEAFHRYEKCDPLKFPVNKMIGIINFQLGNLAASRECFLTEAESRWDDIEIKKYLKYLTLREKWGYGIAGKNAF